MEDAESYVAKAPQYLANLVASSETFRAVVGAADQAAAHAFIHWPETVDRVDEDGVMQHARPRCLIGPWDAGGLESKGPGDYWDYGTLQLCFEFEVPTVHATSKKAALRWFQNRYGNILMEMMQNRRGAGERLYVKKFEPLAGPDELDDDELETDEELGDDEDPAPLPVVYGVVFLATY